MSVQFIGVNPHIENVIRDSQTSRSLLSVSKPGDNFGPSSRLSGLLHGRSEFEGLWRVECQGAVTVEDPEKVSRIFGRYGIGFRNPPEMLHYTALQKLFGHLRNPDIVELEKVLSGGGSKWVEEYENLVVNQGLDELLNQTLAAQTQITAWYVGLKNTGTPAAGDTPSSHGTWTENTTYSEGTRQAWTANGAASSQSVTNSSARATFSINGTTTIFGAFLISNSTKGGTTGKLYAAGNFSSSRDVISGDSLLVTATFSSADDGV